METTTNPVNIMTQLNRFQLKMQFFLYSHYHELCIFSILFITSKNAQSIGDDCMEEYFCSLKLALSNDVLVQSIAVSVSLNRRLYF